MHLFCLAPTTIVFLCSGDNLQASFGSTPHHPPPANQSSITISTVLLITCMLLGYISFFTATYFFRVIVFATNGYHPIFNKYCPFWLLAQESLSHPCVQQQNEEISFEKKNVVSSLQLSFRINVKVHRCLSENMWVAK